MSEINHIEQVVGVRFSDYELFKLVLNNVSSFSEDVLDRVSDDYWKMDDWGEDVKNTTLDDVNKLMDELILEKENDIGVEDIEPDIETISKRSDIIDRDNKLFELLGEFIWNLQYVKLPGDVRIFRRSTNFTDDFIVGIRISLPKDHEYNDTGMAVNDMISRLNITTEKVTKSFSENITWLSGEVKFYIVQQNNNEY